MKCLWVSDTLGLESLHRLSEHHLRMVPEFVFKGEIWFVFVYSKFSLQRLVSLSGTFSLFLFGGLCVWHEVGEEKGEIACMSEYL